MNDFHKQVKGKRWSMTTFGYALRNPKVRCRDYYASVAVSATAGFLLRIFPTVSESCAPFPVQYAMRSCLSETLAGFVCAGCKFQRLPRNGHCEHDLFRLQRCGSGAAYARPTRARRIINTGNAFRELGYVGNLKLTDDEKNSRQLYDPTTKYGGDWHFPQRLNAIPWA